MFKAIAAVTALAVGSIPYPSVASSPWDRCSTVDGYHVCAIYGDYNDTIGVSSTHGHVRFGIKCQDHPEHYTWEWKIFEASTGNTYTKQMLNDFSEEYCKARLYSSTGSTYSMA